MFFFPKYIQPDESIVFYPGPGIDLSPLLIPSCNGKGIDTTIRFVYCDIAHYVAEFFYDLKDTQGNTINLEQYKSFVSRYRRFTDSLNIQDVTISNPTEKSIDGNSFLKASFTITYKDGEVASPQLFFFPHSAEVYLDSLHKKVFDEQIHTIIHITQTDHVKSGSTDFFAPGHFTSLLETNSELKKAKFLITDNTQLFTENSWDPLNENFPGWGAAGNSMIHDRSAEVLIRRSQHNESFPIPDDTQKDKLKGIQEKLDELQFKW